jgi:hypothetical protein
MSDPIEAAAREIDELKKPLTEIEKAELMGACKASQYEGVRLTEAAIGLLRRALFQLDSLSGWRDIATAPKDGTRVLLFNPGEPPYQCVGCWLNNTTGGGWVSSEWDVEPSHWQPLPPPPEEQPNGR